MTEFSDLDPEAEAQEEQAAQTYVDANFGTARNFGMAAEAMRTAPDATRALEGAEAQEDAAIAAYVAAHFRA